MLILEHTGNGFCVMAASRDEGSRCWRLAPEIFHAHWRLDEPPRTRPGRPVTLLAPRRRRSGHLSPFFQLQHPPTIWVRISHACCPQQVGVEQRLRMLCSQQLKFSANKPFYSSTFCCCATTSDKSRGPEESTTKSSRGFTRKDGGPGMGRSRL